MKTQKCGKLTAAQKRVAIAKDVLEQIKASKIQITTGVFVETGVDCTIDRECLLSKDAPTCEVCAVGAAIVSGIRLFNEVSFYGTYLDGNESWRLIRHFFPPSQAVLIENAFEYDEGFYCLENSLEDFPSVDTERAIEFGFKYEDSTARAIAIFKNIVANNGVFKP